MMKVFQEIVYNLNQLNQIETPFGTKEGSPPELTLLVQYDASDVIGVINQHTVI